MTAQILAGSANPELGEIVAASLGTGLVPVELATFADGEMRPTIGPVAAADVYVVQSTGPPAHDNLVELLLLLDACRRAGARRVTAVVPYLGYARQDRRSARGESLGIRVVADLITQCGADGLVVVDPHTPTLEASCAVPVMVVSAVPMLARAVGPELPAGTVVVAADLGAAKMARRYAEQLHTSFAVVSKLRLTDETVRAEHLLGEVADHPVLVVDDMISTGATIEAAVDTVRACGSRAAVHVLASHGLFVGPAAGRLHALGLQGLIVTDSLRQDTNLPIPVRVESIGELLADAIRRLQGE